MAALGISILIAGIGAALYFNLPEEYNLTVLILVITTLGILASFIKRINRIEKTFQAGMYLILVFCLVVSSMADFSLFTMDSWPLLMWIVLAVIGSLLLAGFIILIVFTSVGIIGLGVLGLVGVILLTPVIPLLFPLFIVIIPIALLLKLVSRI